MRAAVGAVSAAGADHQMCPETRKDQDMTNPAPEGLIPFLVHEDRLVRSYTARLLGLDNEERVEQYLKSIPVQGSAPLRRAAVQAMGDLAEDWAIQPLEAALRDADPAVRAQAARALGRLGDATAVPELIALLSDPENGVQNEALRSLSSLRDPRAIPSLTLALQSPDRYLRRSLGGAGRPRSCPRFPAGPGRPGQRHPGHRGGGPGSVAGSGGEGAPRAGSARSAGGNAGRSVPSPG